MSAVLYQAVAEYVRNKRAGFHMPGHGGVADCELFASAPYDVTELDGLDNLLCPSGVIAQAEAMCAAAFGAQDSLMLTCGGTCGLHIAMRVLADYGDRVAVWGNMHASFTWGCMLAGLQCVYCTDKEQLDRVLADAQVCAVCVTSPDYFGQCADLAMLADAAHRHGKRLFVDAAHGAHFGLHPLLPKRAERYADLACVSMHKTLPVYGGGALLQIMDKRMSARARYWRNALHTTSPSYLTMASMDYAREWAQSQAEHAYGELIERITQMRLPAPFYRRESDDVTRVGITADGVDMYDIAMQLQARGIWVELACDDAIVCIATPRNADKLDLLRDALGQCTCRPRIERGLPKPCEQTDQNSGDIEWVELSRAVGRISAVPLGAYPPAVPIVRIGQRLNADTVQWLMQAHHTFGLQNGRCAVFVARQEEA